MLIGWEGGPMKIGRITPQEPNAEAVQPPMMYIQEKYTWEYKRIDRPLEQEQLLNEQELNALGGEGWELVTSVTTAAGASFYLRRPGS
jgi:hypothetical protein